MTFFATERSRRWLKFLAGGALNTAISYAVYLALRLFMDYQLAYLAAYITGILFSYYYNARFVFHAPLSYRGLVSYPVVYIVQYAASALLLRCLVEYLHVSSTFAPLIVTIAMVPATYAMSKFILLLPQRRRGGDS